MTLAAGLACRKLLPVEAAKLIGHFDRLTPDESINRFMGAMSHASVRVHCERINWFRTIVIGCFEAGVLRGSAEVHAIGRVAVSCEVAIAVETAWQERGVATELLHRAFVVARNRALREVHVHSLADNHKMQNVARKFGATMASRGGQSDACIRIPAATCASLCEEAVGDGLGWMSLWFDPIAASLRCAQSAPEGRSTASAH